MDEYIKREAALRTAHIMRPEDKCLEAAIANIPATDVAPVVHGRWIRPHWKNSNYCYDCSECGGEAMHRDYQWAKDGIYPICPNCGARMDADVAPMGWISVKDKLPEPETEVLAVCVRNGYRFICPVIYEDGTILTQDSMWNWYELDNYGTYSEENDDYFVPEGWWENRQFTPDDVYNNPVDCAVTHWMLLPEPPKDTETA